MRDALELLSNQLGCPITYEDPQYASTEAVHYLYPSGPLVPRDRELYYSYDVPQNTSDLNQIVPIVQSLVDKYNAENPTVFFQVKEYPSVPGVINVFPVKVMDKTGRLVDVTARLETRISVNLTGSIYNIIQKIGEASPGEGDVPPIGFVDLPNSGLSMVPATLTVMDTPMRECLDQLLRIYNADKPITREGNTQGDWSWDLAADPDWGVNDKHIAGVNSSVLFWFSTSGLMLGRPQSIGVHVESERPLAQSVAFLSRQLRHTSIYEDPPWECDCEVLKDRAGTPWTPRGGVFTYWYNAGDKADQVFMGATKAYNHQDNPGQFAVKPEGQAIFVYPTQSMKAGGAVNIIKTPVLDAPLTFSMPKATLAQALRHICKLLSLTSSKEVMLGTLPDGLAGTRLASCEAHDTAAAAWLSALAISLHRPLIWQLLYDPHVGHYSLNLTVA